jgi:hypothetical protein
MRTSIRHFQGPPRIGGRNGSRCLRLQPRDAQFFDAPCDRRVAREERTSPASYDVEPQVETYSLTVSATLSHRFCDGAACSCWGGSQLIAVAARTDVPTIQQHGVPR